MSVSSEDILAKLEEMDRENAQSHVLDFGHRISRRNPARHHIVIGRAIQQWIDDPKLQRLIMLAPPRHAKSWYASWFAPAFLVGYRPGCRIMHVTHSDRLSKGFGRRVRNTISHPRFPWPDIAVVGDRSAAQEWETTNGCEYAAFGMDGSTAGKPADYLIVDDPIKGRREAFSEQMRETRWQTCQYDLWSRLEGPQKQLWLLTRWHQDDPIGRVLGEDFTGRSGWYTEKETGDQWYVLSLPAIAEHDNDACGREVGEWLWPEEHGDGKAIDAARKRGGYLWSALYQQRPAPEDGLFFQADTFCFYNPTEIDTKDLMIYGASDYAVSESAGAGDPDWTVHMIFGVDRSYNVYVLDMWRGRTTSDVWIEKFVDMVLQWKPIMWAEEQGQIIKSVGPFIQREMMARRATCARRQFASSTSKEARAQIALGLMQMRRVFFPRGAPWMSLFEQELKQFPAGRHDDMVDTLSLFCRMLGLLMTKPRIVKENEPPQDSLDALYAARDMENKSASV